MILFIYLLIGVIAGTLSGMLGVGGGVIVVPALLWAYHYQALPPDHLFHLAAGTSLAIMVPTTLSTMMAHIRYGHLQWLMVRQLLPGLLVGVISGAMLANLLPRFVLQNGFALFVLYVAIRMALCQYDDNALPRPLRQPFLSLITLLIGTASGLMGIGLGSLGIPFLLRQNVPLRHASAIIITCTTPIALFGAISFMIVGRHALTLPHSSGYIYWPAVIGVSLASIIAAPLAAKLSRRMRSIWLRRLFALFLFLVSLSLFLEHN